MNVNIERTVVASYQHNGVDHVVSTYLDPIDVMSNRYDTGTSDTFPDLDRFNRVKSSRWNKDLSPVRNIYKVDLNFNIKRMEDNVYTAGKDIKFTMDKLNRLTDAQWGTWNGSAITSEVRQRTWTLSQTGNWNVDKLDLENDNDYNGTGEYDDLRTHNTVNELTHRDTDNDSTDDFTHSFTKRGDLIGDGVYQYVYDVFGRMRFIKTGAGAVVAEHRYSGLGHRIAEHYDVDVSGTVNSSDPWYYFIYDDQWRMIATYRGGGDGTSRDANPKEQFYYHNAGLAEPGRGSSYIDLVILRDRDANTNWEDAADSVLEQRIFYCQNWRADVVALVQSGRLLQQVRYGEYGEPFGIPIGDIDGDGDCNDGSNTDDSDQIQTWISGSIYDVRGDLNLDGVVNSTPAFAVDLRAYMT